MKIKKFIKKNNQIKKKINLKNFRFLKRHKNMKMKTFFDEICFLDSICDAEHESGKKISKFESRGRTSSRF